MKTWTITRQLALGFVVLVALITGMGVMSVYSLRSVADAKDDVINHNSRNLIEAEGLFAEAKRGASATRGYLMTGRDELQVEVDDAAKTFELIRGRLAERARDTQTKALLAAIYSAKTNYLSTQQVLIGARRNLPADSGVLDAPNIDAEPMIEQAQHKIAQTQARLAAEARLFERFDSELRPKHNELVERIQAFIDHENDALRTGKDSANEAVADTTRIILLIAVFAALAAAFFATWLTRRLASQIGSTIHNVRSSSAELESAANEQATGARQQSSAMSEISTTMTELLATSRQIAGSAQRVSEIASKTERAAGAGGQSVREVADSVADIRTQVDLIVEQMLELGDRSQRIGLILELIDELAEQTNILAINATIEAAGAGDAGRRFGVVADEIRKLSDRVSNSTGEVRGLVNEIQTASSTTVMATEGGAKAVAQGHEKFAELIDAFNDIAALVEATTEAAQEIELSTTQQTSAVEQVNLAINDVAQAAREAETATAQTFQTASSLAAISDEMGRMIEAS